MKSAQRVALEAKQQFYELLPDEKAAAPLGMSKSRQDTIVVMDKVFAEVDRFISVDDTIQRNRKLLEQVVSKKVDEEAIFVAIVAADAKRVTRFVYPPIGGADSRLSTDLKAIATMVEDVEKETDEQVQIERALGVRARLELLEVEFPRLTELIEQFHKLIGELLKSYPEFVREDNKQFTAPMKDFSSCKILAEEITENMSTYKIKLNSLKERLDKLFDK